MKKTMRIVAGALAAGICMLVIYSIYTNWPFMLFSGFIRDHRVLTEVLTISAGMFLAILVFTLGGFASSWKFGNQSRIIGWLWIVVALLCLLSLIFTFVDAHTVYNQELQYTNQLREYASYARSLFIDSFLVVYNSTFGLAFLLSSSRRQTPKRTVEA